MELYEEFAAAFVRGLGDMEPGPPRLHRFKKTEPLERVRKVLGMLRGMASGNLLDIGSGRGAFLWPLLDAFPQLPVTVIEWSEVRAGQIEAVRRGGVSRLSVARMDAARPGFRERSFDVVTMLEVLEHLEEPQRALDALVPLSRRFFVLSVPSRPDDNPEHLHLFSKTQLEAMLLHAGARRVQVETVLNHYVVSARVDR
ncbi:MAG: class I SAM-dependent methyltransferase [Bryobacteraceae bacterium]